MVASRAFGIVADLAPCGPTHGAGTIIALEMVRDATGLAEHFGSDPRCAGLLATAHTRALWLDMLAFIPAYTAFLMLAARALSRTVPRVAPAAAIAVLAAGLLDEAEGVVLLALVPSWPSPPDWFGALFWTVRPKFALLGVAEILLALLLVRGSWPAKIAAVPLAWGGAVSLCLLFTDPHDPLMMRGHFYAWAALLVVAVAGAVRPEWIRRR